MSEDKKKLSEKDLKKVNGGLSFEDTTKEEQDGSKRDLDRAVNRHNDI